MPTVTKADEVIKAAKELTETLQQNLPSQMPATNYEALKNLSRIYDEVAQEKILEANREEPAVVKVLEDLVVNSGGIPLEFWWNPELINFLP